MKTVFVVKKSSDMVEGRGVMLVDSVWSTSLEEVTEWVNAQGGGMNPNITNIKSGLWRIEEMPLFESSTERVEWKNSQGIYKAIKRLSRTDALMVKMNELHPKEFERAFPSNSAPPMAAG